MSIHNGAHARVEGHSAQVLEPGDAHAFEAAVERAREKLSRFVDGERCTGIGPAIVLSDEGKVGHRTPQASRGAQRRPRERRFRVRYAADGRPEADDIAEAAGFRSEPPVSVPSATGTIPQASATAAPPEDPPHVLVRS